MKEPKLKTVYVCSNCGETSPRWMGRCPSCGSWNTMNVELINGICYLISAPQARVFM